MLTCTLTQTSGLRIHGGIFMTEDMIDMVGVLHFSSNVMTFGKEKFKGRVQHSVIAKIVSQYFFFR